MVEDRILFICPALLEPGTTRGGGIEEIDYQLARGFSSITPVTIMGPFFKRFEKKHKVSRNFEFHYVHFPASRHYPPKTKANLYMSVLVLNPLYSVLLGITLISFLIREKPSLVILHNGLPGLISSIICRLAHKQLIFSEGNLTPWTEPYLHPVRKSLPQRLILKINKRIGKTIAHLSNCVRAQSLSIKTGMVNAGIPEGKIVVIEGGVDVDSFHPVSPPRPLKDSVNAAFIGRLMEEKGVKILIDIVHIAQTELPNLRFYIFGDGQYRNSFGGCSNIEHLGPVLKSELNVWLDKVDIVLFFQKDLGLAELESLAAGKTILVCNVGEIPKIIHHGQNGILCNPQPRAYIDAIRYLLENPSTTDIISENARITAVEQFSWSVIIDKWMKLIKNCKGRNIQ